MSTATPTPTPYRVVYSQRVQKRLIELADIARRRGDGEEFISALKEFDRLLHIYPQFGEQLVDLKKEPGQVWIGTVRPLTMRYGVFDERRTVIAGAIPVLLRKSKPEGED